MTKIEVEIIPATIALGGPLYAKGIDHDMLLVKGGDAARKARMERSAVEQLDGITEDS